jgi:hypothetical protein
MRWIERILVVAILCLITAFGWRLGVAAPANDAVAVVSIRSGSATSQSGVGNSRTRSRVYVGGGFHGGK